MVFEDSNRKHALKRNGILESKVNEVLWNQFLANSLDAVIVIDLDGTIQHWSPRSTELFGWSAKEAIGSKLASLMIPPGDRDAHWTGMQNFRITSDGPVINRRTRLQALHQSGQLVDVELSVVPVEVENNSLFIGTMREWTFEDSDGRTTPNDRQEEFELERTRRVDRDFPGQLSQDSSLDEVIGGCIREITSKIDWPVGHGLIVDKLGKSLIATGVWDGQNEDLVASLKSQSQDESFQIGAGIPGRVWEDHEALWLEGDDAQSRFDSRNGVKARTQSIFAIPVFVDGDIVAILEFFNDKQVSKDPELISHAIEGSKPLRSFLERKRWQELRSFLATIVESSTDAIIGKNRHGKIVSWNRGAEIVYGYAEEEAIGESIQLILPSGTNQEEQEIRDVLQSGRPLTSFETVRKHKSGELLEISLTISPIRNEQGQLIGSATIERDITPLKETIRELSDREEKLRLLMEASGEAIYGIDKTGKCTFANRACAHSLGFDSSSELLGQNMHALIHSKHQDGTPYALTDCPIQQSVEAGISVHLSEEYFWRKDGTSFPVDYWSSPIRQGDEIVGAVVIFEDATQKLQAERTHAELLAIVESSGDAIIGTTLDGIIKSWNRAATRLYGYEADEAIGNSYSEFILKGVPDESAELEEIRDGWTVHSYESRRERKDGQQIEVGITESGIRDPRGNLVGVASIERDITQWKRREADLNQARLDAEIANQAKSEFVANISHELRTPMNAVLGMLRIALEESLPAALRDYLATARESAETLLLILDDLLDFSRMQSGKFELDPEPFHLRETVENAMRTLANRAHEKGLEFAFDVDSSVPDRLEGDGFRLRQVIMNLAGNSIKFTDSGEVFVDVKKVAENDTQVTVECRVRDTGVGIPAEFLERIFDPFTQVDASTTRSRSGSGLGLSICQELVEKMGGEITATSTLGQGTEFCFTAVFGILEQVEVLPDTRAIATRRTLIIDDNKTNREILSRVLSEWDVQTVATHSAEEGIKLLHSANSELRNFSLVIVDSGMPQMSGIEFIREIRNTGYRIPVILMASPSEKLTFARETKKLKSTTLLEKPVTRSDVFDAIVTVLKGTVAEMPVSNLPQPKAFRSLNLLVAEDTAANQKVIRAILERRGHAVTIVETGVEALETVQDREFDAILMDIQMPFMDGIQATKAIRSLKGRYASIPIIAMTAHARLEDRRRCLKSGMTGYVSKPIHARKMIQLIERLTSKQDNLSPPPTSSSETLSSNSNEGIVDLEIAVQRMGGDQSILDEMIRAFLDDAPTLVEEIQQGLNSADARTIQRAAHSLKGLAANFEANQLVKTAFQIEQMAKTDQGQIDPSLVKSVIREFRKVSQALGSRYERSQ